MALTKVDSILVDGAINTTAAGNVGIGTSSPDQKLDVRGSGAISIKAQSSNSSAQLILNSSGTNVSYINYGQTGANPLAFYDSNSATERMRIDSSGNLLVGTTTVDVTAARVNGTTINVAGGDIGRIFSRGSGHSMGLSSSSGTQIQWWTDNGSTRIAAGGITSSGSSSSYVTSSDYRLKENIAPMTGALAKVSSLKPCTYTWKESGEESQGFIAHELQAVVPECVVGEKDAVNEDGSIKPQGIDTSFLTATLTAAIQELHDIVKAQALEIAELKSKP